MSLREAGGRVAREAIFREERYRDAVGLSLLAVEYF